MELLLNQFGVFVFFTTLIGVVTWYKCRTAPIRSANSNKE